MERKPEPLFIEERNRFVMFPIKYHDIWAMYKQHEASFWTTEEIDFSQDLNDWEKLSDNEKHFIKHILSFFAASDGIVMENLCQNFSQEIKVPEVRAYYTFQMAIESIHSNVYSLLIDTYVKEDEEKEILFNAIHTIPSVKKLADWSLKWISSTEDYAIRLIAFAIIEGILFSGPFCSIAWLKERGLMPGLTFSNELIANDESSHTMFAVLLYTKYIVNKPSEEVVHSIIKEAVEFECEFITESLPCNLLGMNSKLMIEYIKFVADRLSVQLGYSKIYNIKTNPFSFMDTFGQEIKTNMFEGRVGNYSKARIHGVKTKGLTKETLNVLTFDDNDDDF